MDQPMLPFTAPAPFTVSVIRSPRRKRTVAATLRNGELVVRVPWSMSEKQVAKWVANMEQRFLRKLSTERLELAERAAAVAKRYDLPLAEHVRWSDNMSARWASCTPSDSTIRISDRCAAFPDWVLDYLLVHELAHLVHADHSPAFWAVVRRYPRTERAIGYLVAKSGDDDDAGLD